MGKRGGTQTSHLAPTGSAAAVAAEPVRSLGRWRALAAAAGLLHLLVIVQLGDFRWDYIVLDGALFAFLASRRISQRLFGAIVPAWITVVLYLDLQGALMALRGPIHTGDLFGLDASLFPAPSSGPPLPWPAWFDANPTVPLDVACGLTYAAYLIPFFGAYFVSLAFDPQRARAIAWCFLGANVLAISCYLLYPAAPPWYVLAHGMGPADLSVLPSPAGAARFDALLGTDFFADFYSRNPNVFGSTPSLHVSYAVMAAWHTWDRGRLARAAMLLFSLAMAFSAVYLAHHYVVDVLTGAALGLLVCLLVARARASLRRPREARRPTSTLTRGGGPA